MGKSEKKRVKGEGSGVDANGVRNADTILRRCEMNSRKESRIVIGAWENYQIALKFQEKEEARRNKENDKIMKAYKRNCKETEAVRFLYRHGKKS